MYLNVIHPKIHGKGKERRTEVSHFDIIKARRVAAANVKLYMNRKDGFIGTSLRKDEFQVIGCIHSLIPWESLAAHQDQAT